MKNKLNICIMLMFISITGLGIYRVHAQVTNQSVLSDDKLIESLRSENIWTRIAAMERLTKIIKEDNNQLTIEMKKACYRVIDEYLQGKYKIDTREDDEGLYASAVFNLAAEICDPKYFSYYLKGLPGPRAQEAIARLGDGSTDKMVEALNNTGLAWWTRGGIIRVFTIMVKKEGTGSRKQHKDKFKKEVLTMLDNIEKIRTDKRSKNLDADLVYHIKLPSLEFLAATGDEDVWPIIQKYSTSDNYYEQYPKEYLEIKKSSKEEKRRYTKALMEGKPPKSEGPKVKVYPVREKASKLLSEKVLVKEK
jgi:hypothetical protein